MIRLFTGWDAREAAGWHAFVDSVHKHASEPVLIARLPERQGDGTKAFTMSRFDLRNYPGWSLYADGCDMICRGDIAELWALRDDTYAVQVVKHEYQTRFPVKYLGTPGESRNVMYRRKNWSSLMLVNGDHPAAQDIKDHHFSGIPDEMIGELPAEWNWLADEYGYSEKAKLLHYTAGMPVQALHL